MSELLRLISLQDPNTRVVLLGTTALGIAAGLVGTFAVLRRRALIGDAVAHAALPGLCVAYFVVGDRSFPAFLAGALAAGVLAAAFVAVVKARTRIKEDAAIAIAIGGFFGVGIVLSRIIQNQPTGNRAGLDSFIFGKAASMVGSDATFIFMVALAVTLAVALFYKELKLAVFDRDFAVAQGWPALTIDLALMTLICVCTVAGLPAVGVVLVVALLVIPAVSARFWTHKLPTMLTLAAAFGGLSGLLGTVLSATLPAPSGVLSRGWPTGPLVVLCASAIFLVSLLVAPRRGLLADLLRRVRLRRRIAIQNLLRDAYEHLEPRGDFGAPFRAADLGSGAAHHDEPRRPFSRAESLGLIESRAGEYRLSAQGQAAAARTVRAHRLWELYLIHHADIAPDHVDRDADRLEHVLPPEVLAELEARLAGQVPAGVPASPHALRGSALS
jgi:manganese/zinc/iron transport system permease protein